MTTYYVMRRGMAHYYAETMEAAIDWATGAAPRNPPRGFAWEIWSNAGEKVATVRYSPPRRDIPEPTGAVAQITRY